MRILTLALTTALAGAMLMAQGPRGPRGGDRTPNFEALQQAISLSDAQLAAIQENNAAAREQARTLMGEARDKHEALQAELDSPNPNPTTVGQLVIDARAIREQIKTVHEDTRDQNLASLDEAQKAALAELREGEGRSAALRQAAMLNLIEGHGGRRGMRGRGGQGMGGPGMGGSRRGERGGGPRA